jgi:hypothetical protein
MQLLKVYQEREKHITRWETEVTHVKSIRVKPATPICAVICEQRMAKQERRAVTLGGARPL